MQASKFWCALLDVIIIAVIALAGIAAQPWLVQHNFPTARWLADSLAVQNGRLLLWLAVLLLLLGFLMVTAYAITGRWLGVLIDGRNKMSLSRLQLITWTVLVLSAYYIAILWRLVTSTGTPTDLALPQELWFALGISVTTLVGSPLILSTKASKPAATEQTQQTFDLLVAENTKAARGGKVAVNAATNQVAILRDGNPTVTHRGQLVVKTDPQLADWPDLFKGEETGNAAQLDLGKVQQFYFTVVVVVAYVSSLSLMFTGGTPPGTLPALAPSLVALLGLSYGGYLVNKAVPHSQS
jgi:hypothetical protein